ncbi:glutamine--tRNA ligase/YqeY domain fusion protein [Herbivorax sp. ANBcel31]|uniref:glutamine--tRNA ligase/YqeY domain fusion protein n=1 Tax=Herbivorax sp. ANBcel31 TaxID=3069754 RepID=UPI0027AF8837|nr:glutamine--tRNA ligase/YqeY domain fusion protein [Herbivorax sp. ANBcel31]MDQ2086789.1 glutamine--tRNA ligase/YqeY domain fusion protein [Herbivorax sp. ANBcel31]
MSIKDEEKNRLNASDEEEKFSNFIQDIIDKDNEENKFGKRVHTRFPPEPNGYLHIGHAKSICLNHGMAVKNNGKFNLRFDDTNPSKEEDEYVESIIRDVKWLGADWEDRLYYASDYFDMLYECAVKLIKMGKAYVCDLNADEIREYRGTLTEPGKNSPYRERSIDENLELFLKMKNGEFKDGSKVLRAKIDMASPNLNMRDPVIYRIMRANHHRTGEKWCVYPMYDFAHPLSDSHEGITHSICTLEFEDHRPLYNWLIEKLDMECKTRQIEFARLNISHTVLSKRKLLKLVEEGHVDGWGDPRMPTISALRRRGYTPASIRDFCSRIGVAKSHSMVEIALLEHCIREELNMKAKRVMGILDPLKVVIDNYPEDMVEEFEVTNNPKDPDSGKRKVPFSKVIYIERDDFREDPPKKYFRLTPEREVRLIGAYFVKCSDIVKDENTGEVIEVHCTYDPESRGGNSPDGRKVKGTIHWVSKKHAVDAKVRLYEQLFNVEEPGSDEDVDFIDEINPDSVKVLDSCKLEPGLKYAKPGDMFQFMRLGYFCVDSVESNEDALVFNRTVSLKDTWAKIAKKK